VTTDEERVPRRGGTEIRLRSVLHVSMIPHTRLAGLGSAPTAELGQRIFHASRTDPAQVPRCIRHL